MESVAERAGVGKPAIYRRHRDKAQLVTAALRSILPEVEVPDTGSAREDLVELARRAVPAIEGGSRRCAGTSWSSSAVTPS